MQSATAKFIPRLSIRVYRAKTGKWEDYGTVRAKLVERFKRLLKGK